MHKNILVLVITSIILILGVAIVIGINIISKQPKVDAKTNSETTVKNNVNNEGGIQNMYNLGVHHASIEVKNYGTIKIELNADVAPITVENFVKLVNEGFYNGLTFHRIMDGFMIQGGDPQGNGFGGSSETIKGEFSVNGIQNDISHVRGVISMARSANYNSASSQFFIVQTDSTFLDGKYAGFGKVTQGMEIVDKICKDVPVEDDNGTVLKENQPIIEKIIIID